MHFFLNKLNNNWVIGLSFTLYFIIGLFIYDDYGMNWDDPPQRQNGLNNWEYLVENKPENLRNSLDRYHGPAFEILLIALEKKFKITEYRKIYEMRHLAVFCYFFISAVIFFLLINEVYQKKWLAYLGVLLLVISPRIFAETFYNPKDITVLSAMIIAAYLGLHFAKKPTVWNSLLLGFALAFAYNIRLLGIIVALPIFCWLIFFQKHKIYANWSKIALAIAAFIFMFFVTSPIYIDGVFFHIQEAFLQMSNFAIWDGSNMFFGDLIPSKSITGAYQLIFMLLTIPVFYTILFVVGFVLLFKIKPTFSYVFTVSCLFLAVFPIAIMWIKHSIVYDGWRHVYCVYPFFILVAIYAIDYIVATFSKKMQSVFFAFLALVLFVNIGITVLNHPFQYCYFNPVANYFLQPTNKNFEMDFWGVSFKQGIEYLLEKPNPTNKKIKVAFSCAPGKMNFYFLEKEINNRLEMVEIEDDFDYYLYIDRPGYQHLNKDWKIEKEFFCQKNVILAVYKK